MSQKLRLLVAPLALLLGVAHPGTAAATIQVETLVKSEAMWDGTSLPDFTDEETEVTVLRITIAPKATLPLHKHPLINAGYLVSGELDVHSQEGPELHLKAGEALVELVDKYHYGVNPGDEPAVIVVFYVGPAGTPLSVPPPRENDSD